MSIDREYLRELASGATPGPWTVEHGSDWDLDGRQVPQSSVSRADRVAITWDDHGGEVFAPADAEFIAAARTAVPALLDMLDQAETTLAAIKARDEEVSTDEGWWIGGAWGDYGEVVVPLRILSYVIDGNLDQKVTETSPDYALTYAEQVARADQAEARIQAVRALHHHASITTRGATTPDDRCTGCQQAWPCSTIRALDGEQ